MAAANKTQKLFSLRLPLELMLEIFSYLPTETLHRIRYIFDDDLPSFSECLNTSSFRNKHTFNILTKPTNEKFLFGDETNRNIIHEIDSYQSKPPSITQSYNLRQLFENILPYNSKTFNGSEVIGGCNGLICLSFKFSHIQREQLNWSRRCRCSTRHKTCWGPYDRLPKIRFGVHERLCINGPRQRKTFRKCKTFHHLILWNPCTGEHHTTPSFSKTICGFGYDSVNNTYKLVIGEGVITQFYDLSTDAWKIVDTIDINWDEFDNFKLYHSWQSKPQFGYYLNDALHWTVSSTSIVSIDLSTEVSSFLNMPHCCSRQHDNRQRHRSIMGVVKGCLSVSCHRLLAKKASIWVMKEYGRDESWTNILNLTLLPGPFDEMVIRPPFWVSRDDEMLFLFEGRLAYRDPETQKINYVKGLKFGHLLRGIVHVDTLVSPKPEVYGLGRGDNAKV